MAIAQTVRASDCGSEYKSARLFSHLEKGILMPTNFTKKEQEWLDWIEKFSVWMLSILFMLILSISIYGLAFSLGIIK